MDGCRVGSALEDVYSNLESSDSLQPIQTLELKRGFSPCPSPAASHGLPVVLESPIARAQDCKSVQAQRRRQEMWTRALSEHPDDLICGKLKMPSNPEIITQSQIRRLQQIESSAHDLALRISQVTEVLPVARITHVACRRCRLVG